MVFAGIQCPPRLPGQTILSRRCPHSHQELLTHTLPPEVDAIELFNPTAVEVDLGGWFLSDDGAVPGNTRFRNTVIAAGGYRVFTESIQSLPEPA